MNKKEIILIGGGGHCKSCIDIIESLGEFTIAGIVDSKDKIGDTILGYKVIGCDADLFELKKKYDYALITVGQIKSAAVRIKIFNNLIDLGYSLPVIKASTAYVSPHAIIEDGTVIMHQVMVNANVKIGRNCIINTKALIEHDSVIGNNCHVSTNSVLNGDVKIGDECFVGSCSTFVNGLTVTNNVFIGIHSVVNKSIKESGIYVGNPIRKIR
jgi:sugar O-acyltransferase (sialic acid O-acetyltransferase NeuD family)